MDINDNQCTQDLALQLAELTTHLVDNLTTAKPAFQGDVAALSGVTRPCCCNILGMHIRALHAGTLQDAQARCTALLDTEV